MQAVRETIEHTTEIIGGIEYPITITRRRGVHTYLTDDGQEILVDAVTITDAGKLGVSCCYTPHVDYTPEERANGRKRIQETLAHIMDEQGLW